MSRSRLIVLLLALGTLAVYLPASHFGFTLFDDNDYVSENYFVQAGLTWQGIRWAFTTFYASNWHPLTWLSHMLDCQLFGVNAGMHHVVNILFHAANVMLLFQLLRQLIGQREGSSEGEKNSIWPSAFIAALFAWHPAHVESVAWISERKDVLSTFFALLTLICYERFVSRSKTGNPGAKKFYSLALLTFLLALLSKPMFVTLPFVMLLLDYWPIQRLNRSTIQRLLIEKIPFFILAAGSCMLTYLAQHRGGMVISLEKLPLAYRLADVPLAYAEYLAKIFWPAHLAILYPLPKSISLPAVISSLFVLILISWAAWQMRKTHSCFLFGWLWFLGTLVPVIGLVQVGAAVIADRYTYFPSIGIFLAVTLGMIDLAKRFHLKNSAIAAAAILVAAACLYWTHRQVGYWRNDLTLFSHAVAVTPDNAALRVSLGSALEKNGQKTEALEQYQMAVKFSPERASAHEYLANLLAELGRSSEAITEFQEALRLDPKYFPTYNAYGNLLAQLGRFDEAREQFDQSMRLNPSDWRAPFLTGQLLLEQGRDVEAVSYLQKAVQLDPNNVPVLNHFARVLASDENPQARDGRSALQMAQKANALSGGIRFSVLDTLAMACAETGRFDVAQKAAEEAIALAKAFDATNEIPPIQQRLELYKDHQPFRQSFTNQFNGNE